MTEETDKFNAMMADIEIAIPVDIDATGNTIIDASGKDILLIDPYGDMSSEQRTKIAMLIVLAVNTCGSFRAVMEPTP